MASPDHRISSACAGEGRLRVCASALPAGADLVISITGGSQPHVGAVAIAQPRPSLRNSALTSATSSVITLCGHKDDVVARQAAERLARALGCVAVVSAGIHLEEASEADLAQLLSNATRCVESLLARLAGDDAPLVTR